MATKTPAPVKRTASKADKLHREIYGDPDAPKPNGADAVPAPVSAPAPEAAPEPAPVPAAAPEPEPIAAAPVAEAPPVDWEARYRTLQGKYENEVPQLQNSLVSTQQLLAQMQPAPAPLMDHETVAGLTADEITEYGPELVDIIRRAARAEIQPLAKKLETQQQQVHDGVQATQEQLQATAREGLYERMNADPEMRDWVELNEDAGFLDWLGKRDVYSGRPKRDLLREAFQNNDFFRVKEFFTGYKREIGQTGTQAISTAQSNLETLVAPGRPAASGVASGASQSGKVWTQAEIQSEFRLKQQGKYTPDQWAPVERDIFAAQLEGRIRP